MRPGYLPADTTNSSRSSSGSSSDRLCSAPRRTGDSPVVRRNLLSTQPFFVRPPMCGPPHTMPPPSPPAEHLGHYNSPVHVRMVLGLFRIKRVTKVYNIVHLPELFLNDDIDTMNQRLEQPHGSQFLNSPSPESLQAVRPWCRRCRRRGSPESALSESNQAVRPRYRRCMRRGSPESARSESNQAARPQSLRRFVPPECEDSPRSASAILRLDRIQAASRDDLQSLCRTGGAKHLEVERVIFRAHEECDEICPICMDKFTGDVVRINRCKHMFHWRCLDISAQHSDRCPMCRAQLHRRHGAQTAASLGSEDVSEVNSVWMSGSRL